MHSTLEFLVKHGYLVLLVWVFLEQAGLPMPSIPLLLAAGALGGLHRLNFGLALLLCMIASVAADTIWYQLGKKKGIRILHWLCRISLEPDSCVRRTEGLFEKQGAKSLLIAKFLPGLNTVATPLAGIFHMKFRRFLAFDALGAILWAGTYLGLGYIFSGQIELIAQESQQLGGGLMVLLVAALAFYVTYKFVARQKFLRELRISRISPMELKEKLDAGELLTIVDLRHSVDFEADPETIPGAFRMDASDLQQTSDRLPHDREVILYCT
ncbi:MAG TPA: VTT domain-containing protein [Candidatus Saccharimonadales bacterium]|jgi:membrane protein DedA with SNARE-associated domain|nr:VTT domain-containing protein [Candidatus Saccharimonadales bacterium]HXA81997.1 VTT domain-containing protein [Methylomirabilota bacterium]